MGRPQRRQNPLHALAWFPRLLRATPEQREQLRISSRGLHWEALDEDISIAALLAGQPDQTTDKTFAAWLPRSRQ